MLRFITYGDPGQLVRKAWANRNAGAVVPLYFAKAYCQQDPAQRRWFVKRINPLSKGEVRLLFPGRDITVERFVLAKSHAMTW